LLGAALKSANVAVADASVVLVMLSERVGNVLSDVHAFLLGQPTCIDLGVCVVVEVESLLHPDSAVERDGLLAIRCRRVAIACVLVRLAAAAAALGLN